MNHDLKEYVGPRPKGQSLKTADDINLYRGHKAFIEIKRRCKHGTVRCPAYKGKPVEFTKQQFLYWWIIQNRFFRMDRPSVGRIDHSKGYSFNNIELQSCSDNTKEVNHRAGLGSKPIKVNIYKNNQLFAISPSLSDAAALTKVKLNAVFHRVSGRYDTPMNGWSFRKA